MKLSLKQTCSKRWTLTQIIFVLSRELPLRHIHAARKQWTLTQRIMFCLVNSHADRYAKKRWTLTQIIVLCLVNSHSNIYKPQVCRLVNSQTDVYTIRTANCYPNTCVLSSELPLRKTCHKRKFSPKQLCCHADIYIQPNVNCELSPKQFERYQGRLANNIKQNVQFVYQKRSILPQILQPEARLEAESLLALRVLVTEPEPQVQVDLDTAHWLAPFSHQNRKTIGFLGMASSLLWGSFVIFQSNDRKLFVRGRICCLLCPPW